MTGQILNIGGHMAAVRERLRSLEGEQFSLRLWRKDPSPWKADPENQKGIRNALGWLHVAEKMEASLHDLSKFVAEIRAAGFRHVVHMGMGGSSLAPLTFQRIFLQSPEALPLTVLDTTDPVSILKIEREVSVGETLFIIASKSGTTAEPLAFGEYFYAKVEAYKGNRAGENFVAITDPGTPLVKLAQERGFRRTFLSFPDIGGRYSALSHFGLVPVALMGINVAELLHRAQQMAHSCGPSVPVQENPGVILGAVMGELALRGRDKLTLLMPESIATLGLWLEQLLAESTGKEGTGVLPVDHEPLGFPSAFGKDRLFTYMRLKDEVDVNLERLIDELRKAGQPVVTIQMSDRLDLAQEFFRWEMATAAAGAILRINPFDQPNVQESKDNTNRLLDRVRQDGKLPEVTATLKEGPLSFYTTEKAQNAKDLLKTFLAQARPGDFFALQAYLPEGPPITQALQTMRKHLRDRLGLATTLGYGPRFLHSTGQFHKGGPNTGLFLQLTADDAEDAAIPGTSYTFGLFKRAQALGDLEALKKHGRRVIRVHLGADIIYGLEALSQFFKKAWE
ncbi:MAG: glucose-6-phosphate isomerase [Deltaproteobacteria bacterium]|nr:glucose-6-phosphate isomerase [Deltaproteobacteria bacterium]